MGCRCLWDARTDKVAEETHLTVRIVALFLYAGCLGTMVHVLLRAKLIIFLFLLAFLLAQDDMFAVAVAFGVYLY
jgi:hypothetical protein